LEKIKAYGICLYKYQKDSIKILLCKSVQSNERWGFLKGVSKENEQAKDTAIREFYEESNISVNKEDLENFFIQKNELKNIGVYLVNYDKIKYVESYFNKDILLKENLSSENSDVEFFDINNLPFIKKKQKFLIVEVIDHILSLK